MQDRLLDYAEAANLLGLAETTLRKRVSRREISHVKLGRLVKFRPSDLDAHLEAHAVPAEVKKRRLRQVFAGQKAEA